MNSNYIPPIFPQQQQQQVRQLPQPLPQLPTPPPPPPPPQQLPEQQQQQQQQQQPQPQQLVELLVKALNRKELTSLQQKIVENIEKASDKCIFNHCILKIPDDDNNELLMQIKKAYNEYSKRNTENKIDRTFKDICAVCVCFKLGLLCQDVSKDLKVFSCSSRNDFERNNNNNTINNVNSNTPQRFQLGHFIHAFNPYKADHPLKHLKAQHASETVAFPSGSLIIPHGKFLIQLLSLRQDTLAQGIKIIQIMSDEKNIEDIRHYFRFLGRNKRLDPGYYKRHISEQDLMKMNREGAGDTIKDEQLNYLKTFYDKRKADGFKIPKTVDSNIPNPPPLPDDDDNKGGTSHVARTPADVSRIHCTMDWGVNFNWDNVFQNGEPLKYVTRGEETKSEEVKMKVFDLSPVFGSHVKSMINIQNYIENQNKNEMGNDLFSMGNDADNDADNEDSKRMKKDYLSLWKPSVPILNSVFYDLLMLGFYNEINVKSFATMPPFNDKCVTTPQNIIFVNKNGDFMLTSDAMEDESSNCSIFNKVLKEANIPLQQKSVITGFSHNVNEKGIAPPSTYSTDVIKTVYNKVSNPPIVTTNIVDEINEKFKLIFNFHKRQSQPHHNGIKNNVERYKNYFCNFKDDMGVDVKVENNEIIFDIATKMFPEIILQSTQNKSLQSLHFSDVAKTKPVLEKDENPNCVYVANLGFVNLVNICDNSPLVLKNTSVYLENLVKRDVVGYYNKTSDNCHYTDDNNDNEDSTRTFSHINIAGIPSKRKYNPENTINLINKKSGNFNHNAYNNMTNCPTTSSFKDYAYKYNVDDSGNCPKNF